MRVNRKVVARNVHLLLDVVGVVDSAVALMQKATLDSFSAARTGDGMRMSSAFNDYLSLAYKELALSIVWF